MPREKPEITCEPLASWRDEAACAAPAMGMEDAWIAESSDQEQAARAICTTKCSVRLQCLLYALADEDAEGVLAGFHFDGGALPPRDRNRLEKEFGFTARPVRRSLQSA